jgi:hypothetical protein
MDTQVAFVENTLAILDNQYLRRLVVHAKHLGYLVRDLAVSDQVQEIEIYVGWLIRFLEALQRYRTNGAASAVLENYLWSLLGFGDNLFQLLLIIQMNPMHTRTNFD